MNNEFDISKFNIIQDEENYYFFRALNMGDNEDIENGITAINGEIQRIRTDRARWVENPENHEAKYNETDALSLEQMYDHIKVRQRKDTNCMSLSSNANIAILYGRNYYKDKYVLIKVKKKEFGIKVNIAGLFMLQEIEKIIERDLERLSFNEKNSIRKKFESIDNSINENELVDIIFEKYKIGKVSKKYKMVCKNKKINTRGRFFNYKLLNEEQNLEKNKIIAKLSLLEYFYEMKPIIKSSNTNYKLINTIKRAFDSLELIHYGEIKKEDFLEVPSKMMDVFCVLQQKREVNLEKKEKYDELKREILEFIDKTNSIKFSKNELEEVVENLIEKLNNLC